MSSLKSYNGSHVDSLVTMGTWPRMGGECVTKYFFVTINLRPSADRFDDRPHPGGAKVNSDVQMTSLLTSFSHF